MVKLLLKKIMHNADVAIIGAGPSGLFAVFQLGMLGLKCVVIDALPSVGGQCSALYPEKPIYDIPAYPKILAGALIGQLVTQNEPYAPTYLLNQQVTGLRRTGHDFEISTSTGAQILCRAVIIAAGSGAFGPNRPPLAGIEAYEQTSVHYYVQRQADFAGKRLVIAGGGDSAVDWAINLAPLAEKIYFVHRRDKFRAAPESVAQLEALAASGKIEMVIPYQLQALHGTAPQLTAVEFVDLDGKSRIQEADHLLAFFGLSADLGPIAEWGLNLDKHQIAVDPTTSATSAAGIFAIGDVSAYPNKLKLILCGFSEAALAAHAVRHHIYPEQAFHFSYSTSLGVPGDSPKKAA